MREGLPELHEELASVGLPGQGLDGLLREIASRARPLFDRPSTTAAKAPIADDQRAAQRRVSRWRTVLGSQALLDSRLLTCAVATDGLQARSTDHKAGDGELPAWTGTLAGCLATSRSEPALQGPIVDRSFDPAEPLPFQDVVVGFIRHARSRLAADAQAAAGVLRPSAHRALERQLLAHLTFVASLTIGRDFYRYRFARAPAAAFEDAWVAREPSTELYRAYVRHMHRGGLERLLGAHPVLARLMSQSLEQWVTTSASFCRRFGDDFAELRRHLGVAVATSSGAIVDLRTDLSDRHHGGQTVLECLLSCGQRVIYKPRAVSPEAALFRFVRFLNDHGLSTPLRELRVLDRGTHGWVEWVAPDGCRSQAEVATFYRRAGMLLALAHVVGLNDVHCDNLIAGADQPVIVDAETLASESPSRGRPSVQDTGMLPAWREAADGRRLDLSALGADAMHEPGIAFPSWRAVNTDQMSLSDRDDTVVGARHRVRLHGRSPSIVDHLPAFLEGLREAYFCFMDHREEIADDPQLLGCLDGLALRVLVRDTATYAALQLHLLHPEFLHDGIDRSIELEWLARPIVAPGALEGGRLRLYERERVEMESLDIPRFTTADWAALQIAGEDEDLLLLCGERDSDVVRRRLMSLSAADYEWQRGVVKQAVWSRFGSPEPADRVSDRSRPADASAP